MTSWAWIVAASVLAADVRAADERIVLRTSAGDMVLALFPDLAPEHVRQILALTKLGVYDGTHFSRVVPNFVAQISDYRDRLTPLTPEQQAAIRPIKGEFNRLRHRRGTLSMARLDGKPDSAETSFSIVLGDVPHLDEKYTVFGTVEQGMDVVEQLLNIPRDKPEQAIDAEPSRPTTRLTINKAEVIRSEDLPKANLTPAKPLRVDAATFGFPPAGVKVGPDYLHFSTSAGDLLVALYPEAAPTAVPQMVNLARQGVYAGTPFTYLEPRFTLQLGGARERSLPLSAEQEALLKPIADTPGRLPHRRGVVSLVRLNERESDPVALLILLADASQLDGKYTVVGHIERGWEVLDKLAAVPRLPNPHNGQPTTPAVRIEIGSARVVPSTQLDQLQLAPARTVNLSPEAQAMMNLRQDYATLREFAFRVGEAIPFLVGTVAVMMVLTGIMLAARERLPARVVNSLHMINLLVGAFGLVFLFAVGFGLNLLFYPQARPPWWLAVVVFFGLLGLLKLLGRFENPS
jgi:cyclophilin family peptidyl-prolyl cis-trans isomerase